MTLIINSIKAMQLWQLLPLELTLATIFLALKRCELPVTVQAWKIAINEWHDDVRLVEIGGPVITINITRIALFYPKMSHKNTLKFPS